MSGLDVKIKNVRVQNFKSIEDLSVRLNNGLNILIGDNGAGKSNFLEFIDGIFIDISEISYGPLYNRSRALTYEIDLEYVYRGDIYLFHLSSFTQKLKNAPDREIIKFSKYKNGKNVFKNLEIPWNGESANPAELEMLINEVKKFDIGYYALDLITFNLPPEIDYISAPGKFIIQSSTGSVSEEGYNGYISSLFKSLSDDVEQKFEGLNLQKIKQEEVKNTLFELFDESKRDYRYLYLLRKYTPVSDLRLNENLNIYKTGNNIIVDNFVLNFKVNGNWLPWSFLSDGTKRLFHIVTETVLTNNDIVLIEEPELGIHPSQLYLLMEFLKGQAENKQIILSSHSPIALDILETDELDNIIITKRTRKGTRMYHLNEVQISKANAYIKKVGKLSDYWLHSDLEK